MAASVFLNPSATASNPFDQELNTTDAVIFNGITNTGRYLSTFTSTSVSSFGLEGVASEIALTLHPSGNVTNRLAASVSNYTDPASSVTFTSLVGHKADVGHQGSGHIAHIAGYSAVVDSFGSADVDDVTGMSLTAYHDGSGDVLELIGLSSGALSLSAVGTVSDLIGVHVAQVGNSGASTVTRARGIWVAAPTNDGGGAIGTYQHLYLENITVGTITQAINYADKFVVNASGDVVLGNGVAVKTNTTTAHTAVFQAYDVNGTTYRTFGTLLNGDVPRFTVSQPTGGVLALIPPTSDPGVAGAIWNNAGTLAISV